MTRIRTTAALAALAALWPAAARAADKPAPPPRVLLAAAAPTRDFQFLRTLLAQDDKRAELSVFVQPPPGAGEARPGAADGAPKPLERFPDRLDDKAGKAEDKPYDLSSYDVIVAFDLDWSRLKGDEPDLLRKWVNKGGGLVVVAGPINTLELTRPKDDKGKRSEQLEPIRDLCPVVFADVRAETINRDTNDPWPLHFAERKEAPTFLKLNPRGRGRAAGWKEFFGKDDKAPGGVERGFYDVYPVVSVKPTGSVVATFGDPRAKLKDGTEMPYLVAADVGKGRVIYLGSGETWRLRQHRTAFFDRFWTEMIRSAAGVAKAEPEQPVGEVALEVKALRVLRAFRESREEMEALRKLARETAGPAGERKKAEVGDDFFQALAELGDALEAGDDVRIEEAQKQFDALRAKDRPELDDAVALTEAARKAAPDRLRRMRPAQLTAFAAALGADVTDPRERLTAALAKVRGPKGEEEKAGADVAAAVRALVGVDEAKSERVAARIVALLGKARGLGDDEFKAKKADLDKEVEKIVGEVGPDEVLRHEAEYALAELLSNPRLEAALDARLK
jgi:hypothetical protein